MQDTASEIMGFYVKWHYGCGLKELTNISRNIYRFLFHLFSIKLLLKTWFSPWHRLHETYRGGLDPAGFLSSLIVNSLMRIVGFVSRTGILIIGSVCIFLSFFVSLVVFLVWIFFPLLLVALLASAIILILSAL